MRKMICVLLASIPWLSSGAGEPLAPLFARCDGVVGFGERWALACAGGVALRDAAGRAEAQQVLATGALDLLERDGEILVAAGAAGLARLRVTASGGLDRVALFPRPAAVYQVAAAPDGALLLAQGGMGLAEVVVGSDGRLRERRHLDVGALVRGVSVAGKQVLACLGSEGLLLARRVAGGLVAVTRLPTVDAREAVFVEGSEGLRAVVADGRGGVVVVSVTAEGLREVSRLPALEGAAVRGLGLRGRQVLTAEGRAGGRLLEVDLQGRPTILRRFDLPPGSYLDAAFSADGARGAWASDREGLVVVDFSAKKP